MDTKRIRNSPKDTQKENLNSDNLASELAHFKQSFILNTAIQHMRDISPLSSSLLLFN